MSSTRMRPGFLGYLKFLVTVIVIPLLWIRAIRFAQENPTDKRAMPKTVVAILLGVLLFAGVTMKVSDYMHTSGAGIYSSLDNRLATAVGESEYATQKDTITAKTNSIGIIQRNLDAARAAGDSTNATLLEASLTKTQGELKDAQDAVVRLEPNHALYDRLHPYTVSGGAKLGLVPVKHVSEDDQIHGEIAASGVTFKDLDKNVATAFKIKDEAVAKMYSHMTWLVYPGVLGLLYAPVVAAQSSILARAFRPSDTVGFKRYPGLAAAFVLALGAFGVPAVPFAAWTFQDMNNRAAEGQITL